MIKEFETPPDTHPSLLMLIGFLIGLSSVLGIVIAGIFAICKMV